MPELDAEHRNQIAEALRNGPLRNVSREYRDFPSVAAKKADQIAAHLAPLVAGWIADAWDTALDLAAHEVAHSVMPNHPNAGYRDGHAHAEQVIRSLIGATRGGDDG